MKQPQDQRIVHQPPPRRHDFDPIALATLAGVVALLMITFTNMRDVDRLDRTIGERIEKLEGQIAQVGSRPAPAAAPAAAPGGIDPNRVHTIKIAADAPARGPQNAPVVIAEFSDFQ